MGASSHSNKNELSNETSILLKFTRGAEKRRRILEIIKLAPRNCNQIAEELKADWWSIQKHLQRLERADLAKVVNLGHTRFYNITPKGLLAIDLLTSDSENAHSHAQ